MSRGAGLLDRDQDESRLETGDVFGIQAQASLDGAGIGALTVTRTRVQLVRACTIPRVFDHGRAGGPEETEVRLQRVVHGCRNADHDDVCGRKRVGVHAEREGQLHETPKK